jgi:hypothetical protein
MDAVRRAYRSSAYAWAANGIVWKRFLQLRKQFDLTIEQIAFTNLAKCFCPVGINNNRFVRECLKRFPLSDLVDRLQPKAIFIAKLTNETRKLAGELRSNCGLIFLYNGRTGQNLDGKPFEEWIRDAEAAYREACP